MNDAGEVGGVDAAADLGDEPSGFASGNGLGALGKPMGHVAIVDMFVDDVVHAGVGGGAVENADDVGVADAAGLACLGRGL